ncbi:hypothetical protein FHG87_015654 [Trinorchestia longiramus]|nr:hypothetical protein FHG87_015654 [Trinorchestia longiramus]
MTGHAQASTVVITLAVVTLLLTTAHARWHDERYHGYELHEATHYHDYSTDQPFGKAYQTIQYHLLDASDRGGFDELFPPLYHGEVSLPPDYPRSVRQKRWALPQRGDLWVPAPHEGDLMNPSVRTLGLHTDLTVKSHMMTQKSQIEDIQDKPRIFVGEPKENNEDFNDFQTTNKPAENRPTRFSALIDGPRKNSMEGNTESWQSEAIIETTNKVDKNVTEIKTQYVKQKKLRGIKKPDTPNVKKYTRVSEPKENPTHMREGNENFVEQNVAHVTSTQALDTNTTIAATGNRAHVDKKGTTVQPRGWVGSHYLNFQSDVRQTEEIWQNNRKNRVNTNIPLMYRNGKAPTTHQRKRHLTNNKDTTTVFTSESEQTSSNDGGRPEVGVEETNAHAGYHTRHGYGNIGDILGDFFRLSLEKSSAGDTDYHDMNRFHSNVDDKISTKFYDDPESPSQKNNLSAQSPVEYKTAADDGDFHSVTENSNRSHYNSEEYKTSNKAAVPAMVNFRVERKEPLHGHTQVVSSQNNEPRLDDHGDNIEEKEGARPNSRWASYILPLDVEYQASNYDARDGDVAYEVENYTELNKEVKKYGTQNYGGSNGEIVYGTRTYQAPNYDNSEVSKLGLHLGSDLESVKMYPLITTVPRDLHHDTPVSNAGSADTSTPVSGYGISPHGATFITAHNNDINANSKDKRTASNDILGKTSGLTPIIAFLFKNNVNDAAFL